MPSLQRTFQTIATQLGALPVTARLLIGSLMIILIMSLVLVSLYTGQSTLSPLGLGAGLNTDTRVQAVNYLDGMNIKYEARGNDIWVPANKKYAVLASLTESGVIDAASIDFAALLGDASPFLTRDQSQQRYLVAKMNVLARMIGQMSGIDHATVVIDQPVGVPGLGRSYIPASASVTVTSRGSELSQSQVDAVAQLVSRSHAGLKPEHVAIVDARSGRAMRARSDDSYASGRYLDTKLAAERHALTSLRTALDFIPGVRIAVNAQMDTKQVIEQTSVVEEPKVGITFESTNATESNTASSGIEPGVQPNVGASIASSGRAGTNSTTDRTETASIPVFPRRESQITDPKGYALKINATIGIPKSYFLRLHADQAGDTSAQPDAAALGALVSAESDKLRDYVTPLIDTDAMEGAEAGTVVVTMIPDFSPVSSGGSVIPAGNSMIAAADSDLFKTVGLGALVVVSLGMMLMLARKATARGDTPTSSELVGIPPALSMPDDILVGEADESAPALEGVELDEDAVRRQEMLSQITDMIDQSPEEVSGVFRRWTRSHA